MIKLSISNIAWSKENDAEIYQYLHDVGIEGLEIAPTRIYSDTPYDKIEEARSWAEWLRGDFNLEISSMQSIWYGHQEKIFGTKEDRKSLVNYTKKAILFAESIRCKNLVFGNPRNRDTEDVDRNYPIAVDFFHEIGEFALEHNTTIAIEPNPTIYNTRFINFTEQAVEMAYKSNSAGIKVNVDLGTIIYNNEDLDYLKQILEYINHVHISEPGLNLIERRDLHRQLFRILKEIDYNRYVSIEMGNKSDIAKVKKIVDYVKNIRDVA